MLQEEEKEGIGEEGDGLQEEEEKIGEEKGLGCERRREEGIRKM